MIVRKLKSVAMAIGVGACAVLPMSAQANPIVELALVIDESGSIGAANFATQMSAYVAALTNKLPQDGSVAVGVWTFDNVVRNIFTTTVITSANFASLTAAISGATYHGGNTAIGDAITAAATQLLTNGITSTRQVIDVSTDGVSNTGSNDVTAANNAVTNGIDQINCLGIGAAANCNFIAGPGAFSILNVSFAGVQTALENKIPRETTLVPEPGTLALLGIALAGLGFGRRKQA